MLKKSKYRAVAPLKSLDHKVEAICTGPPHGLIIYHVSAQSDENCRKSYPETNPDKVSIAYKKGK